LQDKFQKTELDILFEASQGNNFAALEEYIQVYKNSFLEIKQIPTPSNWKEIHKMHLSILLGSANIFEAVKFANEDPLRGFLAIKQYQQILGQIKQMTEEVEKIVGQ